MKRIASIPVLLCVLLSAAAVAPAASAAGHGTTEGCRDMATAAVSRHGVAAGDIRDIFIDVLRSEGEGTSVVTDVKAWLTVRQCAKGHLMVQMTPGCLIVEEVYTEGGCTVPGVAAY